MFLPPATPYLFVSFEDSSQRRDLFFLSAEKRFELQDFLQEAFGVPLCLAAAAEPRVRHGAPLPTQVHGHLRDNNDLLFSVIQTGLKTFQTAW